MATTKSSTQPNRAGDTEIICGLHAVNAALSRSSGVVVLWVDRNRSDRRMRELLDFADKQAINIKQGDARLLDKKSNGVRHQGVVAEIKLAAQQDENALMQLLEHLDAAAPPLLLVLDQVQDPHNLGACLRTAEGAGVDAVILPKDGAAPVNQTVRRVAAGAVETIPVFYVTNLSRSLNKLRQAGIWITGTIDQANTAVYDVDLSAPTAIVMGAESSGLRSLTRKHCDQLVSIPMAGAVSSLNVSVATGVVLFEAVRQRKQVALAVAITGA